MVSQYPGPIVGVISTHRSSAVARWIRFYDCRENTERPEGLILMTGEETYDVADARNKAIEEAKGLNAEWIWLLDDDQTWDPDCLLGLLSRQVDIVQPLTLMRMSPFMPVGFDGQEEEGFHLMTLKQDMPHGLLPVKVTGGGCLLVRRKVWETIPSPWFRPGMVTALRGTSGEDTAFSTLAIQHGFQPYIDLENRCGHLRTCEVWPHRRKDGSWATRLVLGEQTFDVPSAVEVAPKTYKLGGR